MENKHIVISVGGSLIVPKEVDTEFLKDFRSLILECIEKGYTFTLFTGGGGVCRTYNTAVDALVPGIERSAKDWLGISITKVNAQLLKTIFGDLCEETIISDPHTNIERTKPILIGSGWKPGWSTDYDAVIFATERGVHRVINISNISHVYTSDPRTNPDAQKLETVTWSEYRKLIPETWEAGLHSPFDPIASKKAEESKLEVLMLDGRNIEALKNAIGGNSFEGTKIY